MLKQRVTLTAVSAAASVALLAGCAAATEDGGSSSAFAPELTTEIAAATSSVASITWNSATGEPTTLDPALSALESNSLVVANLCEGLQTQTQEGVNLPGLATSIEMVDPLTWVITVREGVTFWDGSPLTAEDVAFSINRVLDPATASSWSLWATGGGEAVVTGDLEVTLKTGAAYGLIENFFALPAFTIVQKAFTEAAGADFGTPTGGVMCTGPYQLTEWAAGQQIVVTKNENWWNTERPLHIDEVTFTFTADPAAQIAALRSGTVDGQFRVPVSGFESLSTEGNLLFHQSYATNFLQIVNTEGPLADVKVRQALEAVIDNAGINAGIFLGAAESMRAVVPAGAWGEAADVYAKAWDELPEPAQDLELAKKLLDEAGYDGAAISLVYPTSIEEQVKVATVIADAAQSIGLNVVLMPLPIADYLAIYGSVEAREGVDTFMSVGYLDFADPAAYYQYFQTGGFYNFGEYSDADYDAAMTAALAEFDATKRAEHVAVAQKIAAESAMFIPVNSDYLNVFYADELTGLLAAPSFKYGPWLPNLGGK